jgi:hypothetical protein
VGSALVLLIAAGAIGVIAVNGRTRPTHGGPGSRAKTG